MLKSLEINNYALIQHTALDFGKGLTIITGETGAGKSILLGGLSLILGKRVQAGLLKNTDKKTIVEAVFSVAHYQLKNIFEQEDLDYESETIIRREITPAGKSRAFVNDTPARLDSLQNITNRLIDIHSQHQTLELNEKSFQFDLIDSVAGIEALLGLYRDDYKQYNETAKEIALLKAQLESAEKELEYKRFQLEELENLKLDSIDADDLEAQLKRLDHIEEIKLVLSEGIAKIDDDEMGLTEALISLRNAFHRIASFGKSYEELANRLESLQVEIQDISLEINNLYELTAYNPAEKESLQNTYDKLQGLLIKHQVQDIAQLIALRNQLADEVTDLSNLQERIAQKETQLTDLDAKLNDLARKIHQKRAQAAEKLVQQIENVLQKLSMKNTRLRINVALQNEFFVNGKDTLEFLISSDAGKHYGNIKHIASGGELSRIMLAIKTILSRYKKLPSIIFDEIDSGVSGEVAQNIADVLKYLSQNMQVIVITHLPQIAVAGDKHYKVFKTQKGDIETQVKVLNQEERIIEIAEMLEGKSPSASALEHARHLLDRG